MEINLSEVFYMPTKIIQGNNCVIEFSYLIKKFGNKALIVTGKTSSKLNGSLEDVLFSLDKEDIRYKIFDDVEENPSVETIEKAVNENKDEDIEMIIAVGGGSALDAGKAIAVFFANPTVSVKEAFTLKNLSNLPVICIPTTSGTGSEVTQYSIITDHDSLNKRNLGQETYPVLAFLDPRYTLNLPYDLTSSTVFDAFSHLVESYLNTRATLMSDIIAEKGFELLCELKKKLMDKDLKIEDREKLMFVSTLAGVSIAQTGTSLPHLLGYSLTYNKKLSHGIANAALYKGYLSLFKDYPKYLKMINLLGFKNTEELNSYLDNFIQYSLSLSDEEIKNFTEIALRNQEKLKNHPLIVTKEDIKTMFEMARRS